MSQVVDVVHHLQKEHKTNVRLVAFFSLRHYRQWGRILKHRLPDVVVIPTIPNVVGWRFNFISLLLYLLFTGERTAICRGLFATKIALWARKIGILKKVCYDGRGAITAEWQEYLSKTEEKTPYSYAEIEKMERTAVIDSDYCIAVSTKLIEYWQQKFGYNATTHHVVPCTLNNYIESRPIIQKETDRLRERLGFAPNDIVLVYAGSTAGWQSFAYIRQLLTEKMRQNLALKILFLSYTNAANLEFQRQFPTQVAIKWVEPHDVHKYLVICDYGILLRENSITNSVAAPTKFAEYLMAGLSVIISPQLGDYSDFVLQHQCGHLITNNETKTLNFTKANADTRNQNIQLARKYFKKTSENINPLYKKILIEMA
jgi:hypothetical protein